MKFVQGHWRLLPGTEGIFPSTVVDVRIEARALVVTGYSKPIEGRPSYLDGTSISARFTSPMPNVIRVQFTHFKGRPERLPVFDLDYSLANAAIELNHNETHAWLKSGDLSVIVPMTGEWQIAYQRDDQPLTASEP